MLKVGLTGGLASGKSFVGHALVELGCHLIEADRLGHEVILPGGEAFEAVVREFGRGILDPDGTINRKRLAGEVFGKPDRLAVLNGLVHPPVFRREQELMDEYQRVDPRGITVVEAAILIETGSYKRFDRLILVVCDEAIQLERACERGAERAEALARIQRQMPVAEKKKFADYVIDTSGSKEETLRQTRVVYDALRRIEQP
ncbi:MAG: dephospho-CoA kinase [Candidatus Solibacter usitatus]|nr:dephospho-CoA kinase [Candidatus Solibacter usitatus]